MLSRTQRKSMFWGTLFIMLLGFGCASTVPTDVPAGGSANTYVTFSLNMQDFAYPDKSVATIRRALDIHEKYNVPVDVFLTGTIAKYYEENAPDLIERLKTSKNIAVSYHVRPPAPYGEDFDWYGLDALSASERYDVIMQYETHGIDLTTGESTSESGGYAYVKNIMGYAPSAASDPIGGDLLSSVDKVFAALGAQMTIVHSGAPNLGDKKDGMFVRPETVDLKLFGENGTNGGDVLDAAIAGAPKVKGAKAPYFVNIKMHDNDFFASASAWTTVYLAKPAHRKPPFDTSLRASLLNDSAQEEMWQRYEAAVKRASEIVSSTPTVNIKQILSLEP